MITIERLVVEEMNETEEIRTLTSQMDSFDFWNNEEEEMYCSILP